VGQVDDSHRNSANRRRCSNVQGNAVSPGQHMAVEPLGQRVAVARELPKSSGSWTTQMVVEVWNIRSGKRAQTLSAGSTSCNHCPPLFAGVGMVGSFTSQTPACHTRPPGPVTAQTWAVRDAKGPPVSELTGAAWSSLAAMTTR